jgi:hypothetical protein
MKPLPDLQDTEAMATIGRTSALWSARTEAMKELRDVFTEMQSAVFETDLGFLAHNASLICERLAELAMLASCELARKEKQT